MLLVKVLKGNQDYLHYSAAQSVGKIILHVTRRLSSTEELVE